MGRRAAPLVALLLVAAVPPARAAAPLDVDPGRDGAIAAAAGAVAAGLAILAPALTPDRCRLCDPGAFDLRAREALRWEDPGRAAVASDLLANGLLPGAVAVHALAAAWLDGGPAQAGEDLLAITEAALLAIDLNQLAKDASGRLRPAAWADGGGGTSALRSFYSGHTSFAFSVASAAGTVASLRGYRSAPWVWAIGMSLATAVGYLRVAGDAHWVTDVVAGAAVGGAVGFAVPWILHRPRSGGAPPLELLPAPGGFALRF